MINLRILALGFLSILLLVVQEKSCVLAFHNNHHAGIIPQRTRNANTKLGKSFPNEKFTTSRIPVRTSDLKALPVVGDTAGGLEMNSDVWVFLLGVFPFAWATVEFWRRIMFGEAFGTGSDQVIIGMDDSPEDSRGRRVLGKGALGTAYFLFAASFATLAVVLYSVISSAPPPDILPVPNGGDIMP
ncbi:unnamed protein product [Cylindrotheca closterium]|uniref:Uncharacterized protein n=1 Tax=Cylindrotheca closterium TaxID=2856 RepID=A0AAD2CVH2_9STRA|nr:unnamed protein product [Cylindrotheca closterium]